MQSGPVPSVAKTHERMTNLIHSRSGSPCRLSTSFFHTPRSLHRLNQRWVFFPSPKSGRRSLQEVPVLSIQNTAFIKSRLSFPCRLIVPPPSPAATFPSYSIIRLIGRASYVSSFFSLFFPLSTFF
jgi:hypothetical protein